MISIRAQAALLGLLCLAGAGLLSSCGTESLESGRGMSPDEIQVEDRLDNLYGEIYGSPAERGAGAFEVNYIANHPTEACMASAGYEYTWKYVDSWASWTLDGASTQSSDWLARLGGNRISSRQQGLAAVWKMLAQNDRDETAKMSDDPEYAEALRACTRGESTDGTGVPDGADALLGEFHDMLNGVDAQFADRMTDYVACMASQGYDVDPKNEDTVGYPNLLEQINAAAPDASQIPKPGSQGGEAWLAFVAFERQALTADSTCRDSVLAEALASVEPKIRAFEGEHAQELQQVHSGWQSFVSDALEDGWAPGS